MYNKKYISLALLSVLALFLLASMVSAVTESTTFSTGCGGNCGSDAAQSNFKGVAYFTGGKALTLTKITKDSVTGDVGLLQVRAYTFPSDSAIILCNTTMDAANDWGTTPGCFLAANTEYWVGFKPNVTATEAYKNAITYNISGTVLGNFTGSTDGGASKGTANMFIIMSIDVVPAAITTALTNPANVSNFTTTAGKTFNATATPSSVSTAINATRYLYNSAGGLISTNFTTQITAGNKSNFSIPSLADGNYLWNIQMCAADGTCAFNTTNFTFTVDSVAPLVSITYPTQNVRYHYLGGNLTLNFTFSDVNPGVCAYNANSATSNVTINCLLNNSFNVSTYYPQNNITLYVNDSAGNAAYSSVNFTYDIFENSRQINATTSSISLENYAINVTYNNTLYSSISAILSYNNTNFTVSSSLNGQNAYFSNTLIIPNAPTMFGRIVFWYFTLTNSTGSYLVQSYSSNQTTNPLAIDSCGTYKNLVVNFTNFDQDNLAALANTTYNIQVKIGDADLANYSLYATNATANNMAICLQNLTTTNYRMDIVVQFNKNASYFTQFYNIQNYTLNSQTMGQNISLYNLLQTSGTVFQLSIRDANYLALTGATVQIDRQYIQNGTFFTAEIPLTDSDGSTVTHFVLNNQIYNIYIRKNGQLIASFTNQQFYCSSLITDCTKTYNIQGNIIQPGAVNGDNGVTYSKFYNTTSQVYTVYFTSVDGTAKTVSVSGIVLDNYQNNTICSSSQTATQGSISCTIPMAYQNQTILIQAYSNGNLILTDRVDTGYSKSNLLSKSRYILAAFLLPTVVLMAAGNAGVGVIAFIIGLIMCTLIFLVDTTSILGAGSFIVYFVMAAGAVVWKIVKGGFKNG